MNYYNDNDEKVCAWTRELIQQGSIPDGKVDSRSITEVHPDDIRGFVQCHFFNGISGWAQALRLAGWPDGQPIWCASLPCQPWSGCGKQRGAADERHLWPVFFDLVRQCRPVILVGEQVERAVGLGWLDGIQTDLEGEGYTVGSAVLGAHSVGSPHRRQRLYWVAYADCARRERQNRTSESGEIDGIRPREEHSCGSSRLGNPERDGRNERISGNGRRQTRARSEPRAIVDRPSEPCGLGDTESGGCGIIRHPARAGSGGHADSAGDDPRLDDANGSRCVADLGDAESEARDETRLFRPESRRGEGYWNRYELIHFTDGRQRRIEPGLEPMVARLPKGMVQSGDSSLPINPQATAEARVMRLRGYGNAIVPQVAAEFLKVVMEIL